MQKLRHSNLLVTLAVETTRVLERVLPVWALHATLRCITRGKVDHCLRFFQDRLSLPKWRERCPVVGMDRLTAAREKGPVILAFAHTGPFFLLHVWLRAHGVPAVVLRFGNSKHRHSPLRRRMDRYTPCLAAPSLLYMDQLRSIPRVLAAGGVLLIATDEWMGSSVKLVDVPVGGDGRTRRMPVGSMRLAAQHGATLFPCAIAAAGPWRYRVTVGPAVPPEHLRGPDGFVEAGRHLLAELMPPSAGTPQALVSLP